MREREHWVWGAVLAGLVGGATMAVYTALVSVWLARPAGTAVGQIQEALGMGTGGMVAAVALHFVVAAAWSAPIVYLMRISPRGLVGVIGTLPGVVLWVAMYRVILPMVGLDQMAYALPGWATLLGTCLYTAATSVTFLPWVREEGEALPAAAGVEPQSNTASRATRAAHR